MNWITNLKQIQLEISNTVEDIIEDHPEMDKIIRKRKEISKELELWQKKIDLMNMQNN